MVSWRTPVHSKSGYCYKIKLETEHRLCQRNDNLKSYGFCYENADEVALVFAEHLEVPTASILFELAQVFPQYKVYLEGTQIKMAKVDFDEEVLEELTPETQLLSRVTKLKGNVIKLASFNQDELVELLSQYKGQTVYYGFAQRECLAYIVQK